jgi:hypothetical protein
MSILSIRRPGTSVLFDYNGETRTGVVNQAFRSKNGRDGSRPTTIVVETDNGFRSFRLRKMANIMVSR